MLYVALDIGCIECGEGSEVLGIFKTEEAAQAVADAARKKQAENWAGEHHFEVHVIEGVTE